MKTTVPSLFLSPALRPARFAALTFCTATAFVAQTVPAAKPATSAGAATNDAVRRSKEVVGEMMAGMAASMGLPPGMLG